nr:alkaline phosphatase family protein [Terriglobales bacterium]
MPTLDQFVNQGVMGNIATLRPVLSPMLWNSIASGKRAYKHGIHGFAEPDPQNGGIRPISSTSRKTKAIWNILTQQGYRTHVLGWFAGHPAEPVNGIAVSDLYPLTSQKDRANWPLADGAVHPASMREVFGKLRMHPSEITEAAILPWIPRAAEIDQENDRRLEVFAKILAENCSIHNAATWILRNEPWDFMAVYYNGIDHFCHAFMHYHPPKLQGVPEQQYEIYKDVVNGAYRFHDMMLATLVELAGPETTIILVSDHGFHSDHLRPLSIPKEPAGPAVQHRNFGIFCMTGPGLKKDERIHGATLLDITPTVLTLYGLPVGEDMDGRVLVQAWEELPAIKRIPSWDQVEGECGMHSVDLRMDPESAQMMMQQFAALGYIEAPAENQKDAVEKCVRELRYNLGRDYLDARRPLDALPLLKSLAEEAPEEKRFRLQLAQCYVSVRRWPEAKEILQSILAEREAELAQRTQDQAAGATEKGELDPKPVPVADSLMAVIHFEEGNTEEALACLLRAELSDPQFPSLHIRIGEIYLRQRRFLDAERAFIRALQVDPESPEAHLGLAITYTRLRRSADAAEQALSAVGLQHFLPLGHYYLGLALTRLRNYSRAILAFETCLTMLPGMMAAHRWLAVLHGAAGGDPEKAAQHRKLFDDLRRKRQAAAA